MKIYGIKVINEVNGKQYLLLDEGANNYVTFDTEADAADFNDDFILTLHEMMTSEIVELSE